MVQLGMLFKYCLMIFVVHLRAMELEPPKTEITFGCKPLGTMQRIAPDHLFGLSGSYIVKLDNTFPHKSTTATLGSNSSGLFSPNSKYFANLNYSHHIDLLDIPEEKWRLPIFEGKEKENIGDTQLYFIEDDILCSWVHCHTLAGRALRIRLHFIDPISQYELLTSINYPYCESRELPLISDGVFCSALPAERQLLIKKKNSLLLVDYRGEEKKRIDINEELSDFSQIRISKDEKQVAWTKEKKIYTLDLENGVMDKPLLHQEEVRALEYKKNNQLVSLTETALYLWDTKSRECLSRATANSFQLNGQPTSANTQNELTNLDALSVSNDSIIFRAKRCSRFEWFKASLALLNKNKGQ